MVAAPGTNTPGNSEQQGLAKRAQLQSHAKPPFRKADDTLALVFSVVSILRSKKYSFAIC